MGVACGGTDGEAASELVASSTSLEVSTTPPTSSTSTTLPVMETLPTRTACNCYSLSEIQRSDGGRVMFTIWDERVRNLSLDERVHHKVETLSPRPIYVVGFLTQTEGPQGVIVSGKYRQGPLPDEVPPARLNFFSNSQFWVGFPMMDATNQRFEDMVNHAGDISLLLDVLEERRDLFGQIDTSRTVYVGNSMGAISGLYFSNTCCMDPRVKAVVAQSGYAADESIGFKIPYDFDAGPEVLEIIGVQDFVIPYSYSSRLVGVSSKVEVLSIPDAGHGDLFLKCWKMEGYMNGFIEHFLLGTPNPVWSHSCASSAKLPGGESGPGSLGPFLVD